MAQIGRKVKQMSDFNALKFVADNPGLNIFRALEKAYEQGKADAMKFIPASENPKEDGVYLVYAPEYRGGSSSGKENYGGVMFSKWKNGKWSIEHGYYNRPGCVKGWMPMPKGE